MSMEDQTPVTANYKHHPLSKDGFRFVQQCFNSLGSLHAREMFAYAMGVAARALFGDRQLGEPELRRLVVMLYGERKLVAFDAATSAGGAS